MADDQSEQKKKPGVKPLTKEEKIAASKALKEKRAAQGGGSVPKAAAPEAAPEAAPGPVADQPVAAVPATAASAATQNASGADGGDGVAQKSAAAKAAAAKQASKSASAAARPAVAKAAPKYERGKATTETSMHAAARPVHAATIRSRQKHETQPEGREGWHTVWPNLFFREVLCCFALGIVLWVVSLYWQSPLELLANPNRTPNPSKAPWYFLGLQEMLVYFDPWIAGVALPTLIIVGLMIIPYIDRNKISVGYYTIKDRVFAWTVFTIGLVMWFVLIIIGNYMRGPSWAFYMPWESFEVHKPPPPNVFDLDPKIGWPLVLGFFGLGLVLPALVFPKFYKRRGPIRYTINILLLLLMVGLGVKIVARLMFAVKYLVRTPWFNI